ncbi:MAG TPA: response regulator [Methylomirabilota bacterium]|nr:response regulator [Methylomirabilota bacterium]
MEDAPDVREVLTVLFEVEGAKVTATSSAREAADLAIHDVFDAIVTDLGLPDMPGDALIREIVEAVPHHARIVVITGYGEPYLTRARRAGADVVLTKPVEWKRVLAALQPPGLAASA